MVKLSDQDRARVVGYVQSGRTELYVAGLFHVHPNTIGNLMRRWRQTGEVKDRPRSGRPRTTSAAEDRQIGLMALRRRATPAPEIRVNIRARRRNGQQGLSVQTVRNRLREQGLRSRKPAMKTVLSPNHRRLRLQWSRRHVRWTHAQWSDILFIDESRFLLLFDGVNDLPTSASKLAVRAMVVD